MAPGRDLTSLTSVCNTIELPGAKNETHSDAGKAQCSVERILFCTIFRLFIITLLLVSVLVNRSLNVALLLMGKAAVMSNKLHSSLKAAHHNNSIMGPTTF